MSFDNINNENAPATLNWRNNRLVVWQKIAASRNADYTSAAKYTSPEAAAKYANDRVRATVRTFMAEILKRASQTAVLDFLSNAPPDWIAKTERLLDDSELVPRLIRRAYPFVTWAKDISDLQKSKAEIDTSWTAWTNFYLDKLGYQASSGFDSAEAAAGAFAGGVSGFFQGAGTVIKWAPYVLAGTAVLVLVAAVRK